MRAFRFTVLFALGILLAAGVTSAAAATYRGKSVDRLRYQGSILNADYGQYEDLDLKFHGDQIYVYFHGGGRIVLTLEDEEITDPHRIAAHDPRRGITWEVNVRDLGGH